MRLLVTGGAGFIGSAFCRLMVEHPSLEQLMVLDKLTYAGDPRNLEPCRLHAGFELVVGDVGDAAMVRSVLERLEPDAVVHFAAETHVDRSIDGPAAFIETNVVGTHVLLAETLAYWRRLAPACAQAFRFLNVSTDEVFGTLGATGFFVETTPYAPRSPYAASKAAADHFVRAYGDTYGLPILITHACNNYGPYHFPEKLIPLMILNAMEGKPLPVYGDGQQVRDWIHVEDHARGIWAVLEHGDLGESYNIGASSERTNMQVVTALCSLMDERFPLRAPHAQLIQHVADRPGHDRRYALDAHKMRSLTGWSPRYVFEDGLAQTVDWYLSHAAWWEPLRVRYRGQRLGQV